MKDASHRLAVFLHDGSWDRMHQGLSIAAAGAAVGRPVHVFLFWWALERLAQGRLDDPDFAAGHEAHADRLEARGVPTLRALLEWLRQSGHCTLYACSGSVSAVGLTPADVAPHVDQLVGWTTILQLTAGVTDRFYL